MLNEHGELLYSQKSGEFEDMRNLESSALTEFLDQVAASARPGCSVMAVNC